MYDQQQTTQLDPLTQALITLKQGASPTTPNGQPTIAGQTMAAMQPQQPQTPPQGGLPGMLPQGGQPQQQGIASIAQNAATGNAIQQQQQQQAQEAMMQMAQQQQQQQQPQMMAEGGLAGLSAGNMGFAEGGIIPTMEYANGGLSLDLSKLYGQGFTPTPDMTGALPTEPESPEVAELRRLQAERVALDKQRIPELYTRGTEAVSAARNEAEAAQQQALKERGMDRLMAVLGAGAKSRFGAGEGYLNFQDAARKADALYAQQKQLLAMQQLEQDKYRYSLEAGSNTAAAEAGKNIAGIKDKLADNAFKIKQLAETARGTDVSAGVRREEIAAANARSAAELASAEKRNQADIGSRERVAGMGQDKLEKAQNLRLFINDINSVEMKKLLVGVKPFLFILFIQCVNTLLFDIPLRSTQVRHSVEVG